MIKLLIATTNPGKFEEAKGVLEDSSVKILGLEDFPDIKPVSETGDTFEENAILKAKGYFSQAGVPTIADDGGLIVDALGGLPGVHSRRWLGREATDKEFALAVIEKLNGVPHEKRTARLGGFVIFFDGEHLLKSENWLEGYIAEHLEGDVKPGFPYRSILLVKKFNKLYRDLTPAEHVEENFRRKNLMALKPQILEYLKS